MTALGRRRASLDLPLCFAVVCPTIWSAVVVKAADWPQWQGPDRNAVSAETGLLQEWPAGGPPLAWRVDGVGSGMGGVAVADGRIYAAGDRDGSAWLFALNEADGAPVWEAQIGRGGEVGFIFNPSGPRATATVDGDRLYILSQHGELVCFTNGGEEVWRTDFVQDHGGIVPTWGYSESVLIDGDRLICSPGAPDATILALDKTTGETIWKCAVPEHAEGEPAEEEAPAGPPRGRGRRGPRGPQSGASYSSAIAIEFEGERQYVQMTAHAVVGVAADDGELLWRYDHPVAHIACSTPIYRDGVFFASSAYEGGGGAAKLSRDASGAYSAEELFFTNSMRNHHGGLVVAEGALYGAHGGNEGGFLACLEFATGDILWRERSAPKGSLALADGRIYYRTEETGEVLLIEPNQDEYLERGRFQQPDRTESQAWTHPVVANGKLYIRDQEDLYCYDVSEWSPPRKCWRRRMRNDRGL